MGKSGRNVLSDAVRAEVVCHFACFKRATWIQGWLKEEKNIEIGIPGLVYYDLTPSRPDRRKVAAKWVGLFDETRAAYRSNIADVAIANGRYQLEVLDERLQHHLSKSKDRVNDTLVLETIETAAKIAGGGFGNRHENLDVDVTNLSLEQLERLAKGEPLLIVLATPRPG